MAGLVFSGEQRSSSPASKCLKMRKSWCKGRDHPWVAAAAMKLAHALDHFGLDPAGAVAMDVGSSTGGFTDVLLQRGAEHVFAVDSGTNQLAWKLRQDPRVTVLEQTSARVLTPEMIDRPVDWVVCDASFIGARQGARSPARARRAAMPAGRADQAAVRGRPRRSRQGRRGARSGAARARLRRAYAAGWKATAGRCRASSRARSPALRAMSSSSISANRDDGLIALRCVAASAPPISPTFESPRPIKDAR